MAHNALRRSMIGERDRTILTLLNLSTLAALHEGRVTPPVQQKDDLHRPGEPYVDLGNEIRGENTAPTDRTTGSGIRRHIRSRGLLPFLPFRAQIDHANLRKPTTSCALRQKETSELAQRRVVP